MRIGTWRHLALDNDLAAAVRQVVKNRQGEWGRPILARGRDCKTAFRADLEHFVLAMRGDFGANSRGRVGVGLFSKIEWAQGVS